MQPFFISFFHDPDFGTTTYSLRVELNGPGIIHAPSIDVPGVAAGGQIANVGGISSLDTGSRTDPLPSSGGGASINPNPASGFPFLLTLFFFAGILAAIRRQHVRK